MRSLKEMLHLLALVLIWPHALTAQHTPPSAREVEAFAERANKEAHVGKRVPIPTQILKDLVAKAPNDYGWCDREEQRKLDAHQILLSSRLLDGLAIQGDSFCYCSATGNCAFWIYQKRNGKYRMLLKTDMGPGFRIPEIMDSRIPGLSHVGSWVSH